MSTRSTRTSTSTPTSSNASPPPDGARRLGPAGRAGVIALMAVGSVAMWLGVPFGLVYAASRLEDSTQPSMGPYVLVLLGVPAGMVLIGKALGALGRFYDARTGAVTRRRQTAWLRSMRGERPGSGGSWRVLDAVMLWSVTTALLVFAVWFFAFAGSSI